MGTVKKRLMDSIYEVKGADSKIDLQKILFSGEAVNTKEMKLLIGIESLCNNENIKSNGGWSTEPISLRDLFEICCVTDAYYAIKTLGAKKLIEVQKAIPGKTAKYKFKITIPEEFLKGSEKELFQVIPQSKAKHTTVQNVKALETEQLEFPLQHSESVTTEKP